MIRVFKTNIRNGCKKYKNTVYVLKCTSVPGYSTYCTGYVLYPGMLMLYCSWYVCKCKMQKVKKVFFFRVQS